MRVALARSLAEVEALRSDWDALEQRTPEANGFQSLAWCRQWLACAGELTPGHVEPRIVAIYAEDRLVMLWPLQVVRWAGFRMVRWIGEPMTQYGDILAEPGAHRPVWQAAAQAAIESWRDVDLVVLKHVREDSAFDAGRFGVQLPSREAAPFIDLTHHDAAAVIKTWEDRLKRRARRLSERGPLVFEALADGEARAAAVRLAFALKLEWLRCRRLFSSGLSHALSAAFLERLAREQALDTCVLMVGETIAAVELGVRHGSAYRSLLSAFDARFSEGSPGHVLTTRLVASAKARGVRLFDFLAPSDDYKTKWASGSVPLHGRAVVLTLQGRIGLLALRLRPVAKQIALTVSRGLPRNPAPRPTPGFAPTKAYAPNTAAVARILRS